METLFSQAVTFEDNTYTPVHQEDKWIELSVRGPNGSRGWAWRTTSWYKKVLTEQSIRGGQ